MCAKELWTCGSMTTYLRRMIYAYLENMADGVMKKYGGSSGGPTILDLHSGALSRKDKFVNVFKVAELEGTRVLSDEVSAAYDRVKSIVQSKISSEFGCENLYLTYPTFFSRITVKKGRNCP